MLPLFDLSLQLNGFPMQEAKAKLQQIVALSESEYSAFLEEQKLKIVQFLSLIHI
jgi:phenylacetate-CoA ligase